MHDTDDDSATHDADDDSPAHDTTDDHHAAGCDASDLVPGATVRRARIDLDGGDAVWTTLKLAA